MGAGMPGPDTTSGRTAIVAASLGVLAPPGGPRDRFPRTIRTLHQHCSFEAEIALLHQRVQVGSRQLHCWCPCPSPTLGPPAARRSISLRVVTALACGTSSIAT